MENEIKEPTAEELDTQIEELKKKRATMTKSSYEVRPLREKVAYDLQPLKLLTFAVKFLIISTIIGAIVFGIGYWKGHNSKPVFVDMKDFRAEVTCKQTGLKHEIGVKNYRFYFDGKTITEGDIPKLKPYGIELHPKLFAGLGTNGPAIGAGFELAHFYKLNLDAFLMSDKAAYVGISYDLSMDSNKLNWFENSSVGLAAGRGLAGDTRVMIYWSIKF
jgi:hypothetical protein